MTDDDQRCTSCNGELAPIYPLGDKSLGVDMLICVVCGAVYSPQMKKLAHGVVLS